MTENLLWGFLKNLSPKDVAISGFSAITGFAGAYYLLKKQEKEKRRQRHWNRIKSEILKPWLKNGDLNPNIANVNKSLFEDLNSHCLELIKLNKNLREFEKSEEDKINQLMDNLKQKYPPIKKIYPWIKFLFVYPSDETYKPIIENKVLRCKGGYLYAEGSGDKGYIEVLEKLKHELEQLCSSPKVKELKELDKHVKEKRNELKNKIESELNKEKLIGNCEFID